MRGWNTRARGPLHFLCAAALACIPALLFLMSGCRDTYGLVDPRCTELADCAPWIGTQCLNGLCACPDGQAHCDNACRPRADCRSSSEAPSCLTSADCEQPDPRCGLTVCARGLCTPLLSIGPASSQLRGNCSRMACDETGNVQTVEDLDDFYDDGNPCTLDTCTALGNTHEELPNGAPCVGVNGICSDGSCKECRDNPDCGDPSLFCDDMYACVPSTCVDSMQSDGETDLNCGGSCSPCEHGAGCLANSDCQSGVCIGNICAKPTCSDGKLNGAETDVDCGTPGCAACSDGKRCGLPDDCTSGVCWVGVCQPASCFDGVKNDTESGDDCGGRCAPCAALEQQK
jgi:hypothetical protein